MGNDPEKKNVVDSTKSDAADFFPNCMKHLSRFNNFFRFLQNFVTLKNQLFYHFAMIRVFKNNRWEEGLSFSNHYYGCFKKYYTSLKRRWNGSHAWINQVSGFNGLHSPNLRLNHMFKFTNRFQNDIGLIWRAKIFSTQTISQYFLHSFNVHLYFPDRGTKRFYNCVPSFLTCCLTLQARHENRQKNSQNASGGLNPSWPINTVFHNLQPNKNLILQLNTIRSSTCS